MNNAISDVSISARKLCEKLTEELGPMETEREHRINSIIIEMAQSSVGTMKVEEYLEKHPKPYSWGCDRETIP